MKLATQKQIALAPRIFRGFQVQLVCKRTRGSTCTYNTFQALSNILGQQVLHRPLKYQ
jgi:hypothetical protein